MTSIRKATAPDLPILSDGLRALARDIGDPYPMSDAALAEALFGPAPICHALIAGHDAPTGLALFTPLVSTSLGGTGAFVSDLWVAGTQRGLGLGERLLCGVLETSGQLWGARYLRLTVYDDNPHALRFYERLGFLRKASEHPLILMPDAAGRLRGAA
ncbi:GNAT family N-acetyltransferase [Oceanibium sediminis]|uniref:GNAT family N-acetyltransferase n=1 Tax=Oceanibium sediminis TaxID=2026339 RepID=UPI000DD33BB2|nr:N-acetyltransferase [Oceanibium sediminis]